MKKAKVKLGMLSDSELKTAAGELRYIDPDNIAIDFTSSREREAIAAVFKWLSLNGICGWQLKKSGNYSTTYISKGGVKQVGPHEAIVLSVEQYDRAKKALENGK